MLSLPSALFDCIIKFATYHPYYKNKLVSNPISTFACTTKLGLVTKKKELSKILSIYMTDTWIKKAGKAKILSLLLSLTFIKMCTIISDWQLSSILAVKIMITVRKYFILIKHPPENTFDFIRATQTIKFLLEDQVLLNK